MRAVELKYANGKGTGFWYCSLCLQVQSDTRPDDYHFSRSHFAIYREHGDTKRNKEQANDCCSGNRFNLCTGCCRRLEICVCGRATTNLCAGCGEKLWVKEGQFIEFGAKEREFCRECAEKLQAKLAGAGKYAEYPGLDSTGYVLK
jgi:hypothetical protein